MLDTVRSCGRLGKLGGLPGTLVGSLDARSTRRGAPIERPYPPCGDSPVHVNACIVGLGTSDVIGRDPGRSPLRLQFESFRAALRDAGLEKSHVDGIVTAWGAPRGVDYDEFAVAAGLELTWVSQLWTHGRWTATTVQQA